MTTTAGSKEHMRYHAEIANAAYTPNTNLSHLGLSHSPTLSNRNRQTYVDDKNKTVYISHRGTNPKIAADLSTDAAIAVGVHHLTSRFKNAERHLKQVQQHYPEHKVHTLGHSLGSTIGLHLNGKYGVQHTGYNTGLGLGHAAKGIFDKVTKALLKDKPAQNNATIYHTKGDVISGISRVLGNARTFITKAKDKANPHSLSNFFKKKA